MRNFIVFAMLIVMAGTAALAQPMKPVGGNVTAEVGFIPWGNVPIVVEVMKLRYFVNDDFAVRCGLHLDIENRKESPHNPNGPDDKDEKSFITLGLLPGVEMHFGKQERFDPYCGAEIAFTMKNSKQTYVNNSMNRTDESEGAWLDGSNRGYSEVQVNIFTGAEYYFTSHIYVGTEMGVGMKSKTYSEVTRKLGSSEVKFASYSATNIGINGTGAIRLGWVF